VGVYFVINISNYYKGCFSNILKECWKTASCLPQKY